MSRSPRKGVASAHATIPGPLGVLGQAGERAHDISIPPKAAHRTLPSAAHRLMGLAMRLVAGRDQRLEMAVLGLDDLVVVLAVVSTWHGPPSCLQVMVFMGGTLRLSGREGFSNPDRSVEDRPW